MKGREWVPFTIAFKLLAFGLETCQTYIPQERFYPMDSASQCANIAGTVAYQHVLEHRIVFLQDISKCFVDENGVIII